MNTTMKVMLVLALCLVAASAFAQGAAPYTGAGYAPAPAPPTPPTGNTTGTGTKGVTVFGTLPNQSGSVNPYAAAMGAPGNPGVQFNSKWNMVNGNHDLTSSNTSHTVSWSSGTVKQSGICSFCHTAHDNEGLADRTWLWAHDVPATSTYGVYSSPTLQAGIITYDPNSTTAKCLGCHDGTLAVSAGNYGSAGAGADLTIGTTQITDTGKLKMDSGLVVPLSRTHPVGFTYDATLAAKHQLRVPAATGSVDGFGIVPLFGTSGNQMECATCHDPHIKSGIMRRQFPTGASQDAGTGSFCLYCHL